MSFLKSLQEKETLSVSFDILLQARYSGKCKKLPRTIMASIALTVSSKGKFGLTAMTSMGASLYAWGWV